MENPTATVAPFAGYGQPKFTQIPDIFLDHQMQKLSGTAVKVMLYIFRHTYGYTKKADAISYRQFVVGIVRADGHIVDQGAGVSERGLAAALDELEEQHLIFRHLDFTLTGGRASTIYEINEDGQAHYQAGKSTVKRPRAESIEVQEQFNLDQDRLSKSTIPSGQAKKAAAKRYPTAKIADTPTAKIADTPTAKIADTINNVSNKQQNNTHGVPALAGQVPAPAGQDVCVALLMRCGITLAIAEELSATAQKRRHNRGYVAQLVAYAEAQPRIVNKAGYLIRMIRDNADVPDAPETAQEAPRGVKPTKNPIDFSKFAEGGKYGFVTKAAPVLVE